MKAKAGEASVIALGLAAFLALSLHQIELPGLNYDEAFDVVPAMQLILGQPIELLRGSGIRIVGRTFPLMVMDYKGTVHTYLAIPFFLLLGINVFALRLSTVTFAALTLLATYFLARELYGRRAAAIAFLLLAVNPSFVFWSRQGVLWTSVMTLFSTGSLFFLLKWWHKKRPAYLYLSALFLGLGLSSKLPFLWFPLALAATWTALGRPVPSRLDSVQATIAFLAFLIGASPLIIYNLQTGGTIKVLLENLTTSYYGTSNLAFFSNLKLRLIQFRALLTGKNFWYLGGGCGNDLYPVLFFVIAVGSLSLAIKAREDWRKVAFPLLMMAFMVVESCATVSSLWPEHYLILLPLPQLAIAAGVSLFLRRGLGKPALVAAVLT
ncbi:MAG: glycosyltransferase family 39 protein, partial [Chloroflexota bacterium]|nr:glycosyltransferase family 39 protein [Chloroflexota bacterium]